jgi:hypothetical protein
MRLWRVSFDRLAATDVWAPYKLCVRMASYTIIELDSCVVY